jgi:DNA-binding MarR family transcriptional regulator
MKKSFSAASAQRPSAMDLDQHVPALCNTIGGYVSRIVLAQCGAEYGIGILEWRIILVLSGEAPLEISQIADRVAMDRGGCSRSIAALEERGLLERVRHEADRRRSPVRLTAAGRRLGGKLAAFARACSDELLSALAPDERATMVQGLNRLRLKAIEMHAQAWQPGAT